MFRMSAHVSLTRDPRATRDMVPPEVGELTPGSGDHGAGRAEGGAQGAPISFRRPGERSRDPRATSHGPVEAAAARETDCEGYRENYFHHRPTWDLERQARGEELEEYAEPAIDLVTPERARLAEILCHQPDNLSDEEMTKLSVEVVNLYVALCGKRETVKRKRSPDPNPIRLPTTSKRIKVEASPEAEFQPPPHASEPVSRLYWQRATHASGTSLPVLPASKAQWPLRRSPSGGKGTC